MKKILSIRYSASAFNFALFVLRVGSGILMMMHGYDKLVKFHEYRKMFINFMGLGPTTSLTLTIFSEFFCSIFIILGLFTRLAAIPLIISTAIAVIVGHHLDLFGQGEHPALFFLIFFTILWIGPGRISVDGMINK